MEEPIAIVGIGCRWPGAVDSPSSFWDLLHGGRCAKSPVPKSRYNIDSFYHSDRNRPGSLDVREGYFLDDDLDNFDNAFFGLNPSEASAMDIQQRKLLEVVYECFESAGVGLDDVAGSNTGCWVGNFTWDFAQNQLKDPENISTNNPYAMTGYGLTVLSNRINHVFDLRGPSLTVDTACSSSLYALHYACQSLNSGDCQAAVVAGTNMILTVEQQMNSAKLGILSPTSMCHTFDISADGYGRGEGVAALYVKKLSTALRDGDRIRGIIRSTAVNSNGKTPGISHPSSEGQEKVIRSAYRRIEGLSYDDTAYVECHGTGTPTGDPIEVAAIAKVFSGGRTPERPLLIGSNKPNIGHTEAVSALASIIKCILAMEKVLIPQTIGVKTINPKINLENGRLRIVTANTPWPKGLHAQRASVCSFGYGGANAHTILESVQSFFSSMKLPLSRQLPGPTLPDEQHLFLISAGSQNSLSGRIDQVLKEAPNHVARNLAYTLARGRSELFYRAFAVVSKRDIDAKNWKGKVNIGKKSLAKAKIGFIFTGQGAQHAGMGSGLLDKFKTFKQSIQRMDAVLNCLPHKPDWSIEDTLRSKADISSAELSQPICTAIQIALVDQLAEWGIKPSCVVGHSSGEIAAAYTARHISLPAAITAAFYRGLIADSATLSSVPGSMMAVSLTPEQASIYLSEHRRSVVIACHNSPSSLTLSGDTKAILSVQSQLEADNKFNRLLKTGGKAYHSHHMKRVGREYQYLLEAAASRNSSGTETNNGQGAMMYSSVTASKKVDGFLAPYWRANLEQPVLFAQAVAQLAEEHPEVNQLVEIGPHPALKTPVKQILTESRKGIDYHGTLKRGEDDATALLGLIGKLWFANADIDLKKVAATDKEVRLVEMDHYPWNYGTPAPAKKSRLDTEWRGRKYPRHDLLGSRLPGCSPTEPIWRNIIREKDIPWLKDHKIQRSTVFPAAGYLSMALEAISQISGLRCAARVGSNTFELKDVVFSSALVIPPDDNGVEVLLTLSRGSDGFYIFRIISIKEEETREHSSGLVKLRPKTNAETISPWLDKGTYPRTIPQRKVYTSLSAVGLNYGETFQRLGPVELIQNSHLASSTIKSTSEDTSYAIHPTLLDSIFQLSIFCAHTSHAIRLKSGYLPVGIQHLTLGPTSGPCITLVSRLASKNTSGYAASIDILDSTGSPLLSARNARLQSFTAGVSPYNYEERNPFLHLVWRPLFSTISQPQALSIFPAREASELAAYENLAQAYIQRILSILPTLIIAEDESIQRWVDLLRNSPLPSETLEIDTSLNAPEARALRIIHDNLPALINGSSSLLELLLQDNLLTTLYSESLGQSAAYEQLSRVLDLLAHENPQMSILEIGAGTGGATRVALRQLDGSKGYRRKYERYVFSDIGSSFVAHAKEEFANASGMDFVVLDIENPHSTAEQQQEQKFDLVLAANVLHATQSLHETLGNVKRLLKPGGRLVLVETTKDTLITRVLLGLLPGYWLGRGEGRDSSPFVSRAEWKRRLNSCGFSDVVELVDYNTPNDITSVIVAKNDPGKTGAVLNGALGIQDSLLDPIDNEVIVNLVHRHSPNSPLAKAISKALTKEDCKIIHSSFPDSASIPSSDIAIVLAELEGPFMTDITSSEFQALQKLTTSCDRILWVTPGGTLKGQTPEHSIISGLQRGIAAENPRLKFMMLDIEARESLERATEAVRHLGFKLLAMEDEAKEDLEYVFSSGVLYVSRVVYDEDLNIGFMQEIESEKIPFRQDALIRLTAVSATRGERPLIEETKVEIEVQQLGLLPESQNASLYMGSVKSKGKRVKSLSDGDLVLSWHTGPIANFHYTPEEFCMRLDSINADTAVARALHFLSTLGNSDLSTNLGLLKCLFIHALPHVPPTPAVPRLPLSDLGTLPFSSPSVIVVEPSTIVPLPSPRHKLPSDGTYFMIGGLGGLGRSLVRHFVFLGARHFLFLSRSGSSSPEATSLLASLNAANISTTVIAGSVTSLADVQLAVRSAKTPINGVIQAAMVLEDGLFASQTSARYHRAIAPKVQGTKNIHLATLGQPLDFFVMTSSMLGVLGSATQANYSAANSYLDAFCRYRRGLGLPATTVALGMVNEVGFVEEHKTLEDVMKRNGFSGVNEEEYLEIMEAAIFNQGDPYILTGLEPYRMRELRKKGFAGSSFWDRDARVSGMALSLKETEDEPQVEGIAKEGGKDDPVDVKVIRKISKLVLVPEEQIDRSAPLSKYGVDSMIAAELRNWFFKEFEVEIGFLEILDGGNVEALVDKLSG